MEIISYSVNYTYYTACENYLPLSFFHKRTQTYTDDTLLCQLCDTWVKTLSKSTWRHREINIFHFRSLHLQSLKRHGKNLWLKQFLKSYTSNWKQFIKIPCRAVYLSCINHYFERCSLLKNAAFFIKQCHYRKYIKKHVFSILKMYFTYSLNPSILQATRASIILNPLSHTVLQVPSNKISRRPALSVPPTTRAFSCWAEMNEQWRK